MKSNYKYKNLITPDASSKTRGTSSNNRSGIGSTSKNYASKLSESTKLERGQDRSPRPDKKQKRKEMESPIQVLVYRREPFRSSQHGGGYLGSKSPDLNNRRRDNETEQKAGRTGLSQSTVTQTPKKAQGSVPESQLKKPKTSIQSYLRNSIQGPSARLSVASATGGRSSQLTDRDVKQADTTKDSMFHKSIHVKDINGFQLTNYFTSYGKRCDKREVSDIFCLYNLFNFVLVSVAIPRSRITFYAGKGNNPDLVARALFERGMVEQTKLISTTQLVWTSYYSANANPTKHAPLSNTTPNTQRISWQALSNLEAFSHFDYSNALHLASKMNSSNLFRATPALLFNAYSRITNNKHLLNLLVSDNLYIVNHIKGTRFIAKKWMLYETITKNRETRPPSKTEIKQSSPDPAQPPTEAPPAEEVLPIKSVYPQCAFLPYTVILKKESDLTEFLDHLNKPDNVSLKNSIWIVKPGENTNRGIGIKMAHSTEELSAVCKSYYASMVQPNSPTPAVRYLSSQGSPRSKAPLDAHQAKPNLPILVVQKYLKDPILYKNRKFDIRCYALIIKSTRKASVFYYREGYIRTSSFDYDCSNIQNMMVHLTNEGIQLNDKTSFGKHEAGNKVYYKEMNAYLNEQPALLSRKMTFSEHILPEMQVITK